MSCNSVLLRGVPGRSQNTFLCRQNGCGEIETLPHVLGFCSKGQLLRITRHNKIRVLLAEEFRKNNNYEVYEETHCISVLDSSRRTDIIVIDRKNNSGLIIDQTNTIRN